MRREEGGRMRDVEKVIGVREQDLDFFTVGAPPPPKDWLASFWPQGTWVIHVKLTLRWIELHYK